jgi:hypothetical protein
MVSPAIAGRFTGGTVTEADHILGDLLHRQSELAVLRIAYSTFEEFCPMRLGPEWQGF